MFSAAVGQLQVPSKLRRSDPEGRRNLAGYSPRSLVENFHSGLAAGLCSVPGLYQHGSMDVAFGSDFRL